MTKNFDSIRRPVFAGIDVGGTSIKVGIVSDGGTVLANDNFATKPDSDPRLGLEQSKQLIEELLRKHEIESKDLAAVGLATPGPMDIPNGMVLTPFNLPGWRNQNVREILSELMELPVTFANDAGAAAFGEYWIGGGSKNRSMILITLGTGVGGGIIIDEKSLDGANSHGAEIGHIIVDIAENARMCPCGNKGHLEAYASATALVNRCASRLRSGERSVLKEWVSDGTPISTLKIFEAAEQDDRLAIDLISETAKYLGYAIVTLVHVIDPQAVLLGGAMNFGGLDSPIGTTFLTQIQSFVRDHCFPRIAEKLTIEFATLGSDAGFIGAAGLAKRDHYRHND